MDEWIIDDFLIATHNLKEKDPEQDTEKDGESKNDGMHTSCLVQDQWRTEMHRLWGCNRA